MTLQDLVNQAQYVAKKAALGVAFGFSLASAPGLTYAYGQTSAPSSLAPPPAMPVINPTNPVSMTNPILKVALGLPATSAPRGAYRIAQTNALLQQLHNQDTQSSFNLLDNGLDTYGGYSHNDGYNDDFPDEFGENTFPLEQFISGISPERQRQFYHFLRTGKRSPLDTFNTSEDNGSVQVWKHNSKVVARLNEVLSFPSLHQLQERYRQVEHNVRQGSTVYKAKFLPGYYVHHPQVRRIYYVERGDVVGKRRTTIVHSIADENGTLLSRANEQGEMVAVKSPVEETSPAKTVQHPLEKKIAETDAKQPTAADIGIFQNIFDCQSKLELYSATGAGVGSLAVIGPLAALYIRHRRRKSRYK